MAMTLLEKPVTYAAMLVLLVGLFSISPLFGIVTLLTTVPLALDITRL
jgi:hypothetical protein